MFTVFCLIDNRAVRVPRLGSAYSFLFFIKHIFSTGRQKF